MHKQVVEDCSLAFISAVMRDGADAVFCSVMWPLRNSTVVHIHLHWLSRYEKFLQMKKSLKPFLSLPDKFWPFTLFCAFVRVTVEQNNHNSAPAWRHDGENSLSVLKTSKLLLFGEAKGPVSVLEHHKWQCVARKRLLLLLN